MVLLEIISDRMNFDVFDSLGKRKFSTWAYKEFEKENIYNIVDKRLGDHINMDEVERQFKLVFSAYKRNLLSDLPWRRL